MIPYRPAFGVEAEDAVLQAVKVEERFCRCNCLRDFGSYQVAARNDGWTGLTQLTNTNTQPHAYKSQSKFLYVYVDTAQVVAIRITVEHGLAATLTQ